MGTVTGAFELELELGFITRHVTFSKDLTFLLRLDGEGKTLLPFDHLIAADTCALHVDARQLAVGRPLLIIAFRVMMHAKNPKKWSV